MTYNVVMPKLGLTMVEGKIVKWIRKQGERVEKGEPLFEVETEKVEMQIEAQTSGILRKIIFPEGSTVPIGESIGIIEEAEAPSMPEKPLQPEIVAPTPKPEPPVAEARLVPLSDVRKTIAQRMLNSLQTSAQLTIMMEADVTELKKYRESVQVKAQETSKVDLTYTDIIAVAVTKALKEYPVMNSALKEEQIEILEKVNLGIAVATDKGLIVPVIRNVEKKSIEEVAKARRKLVEKAREGGLSVEDVEGGTFTVTNLGMYGVSFFTPIINPPQSAILGVGAMVEKPSVVNGQISTRLFMPLSLTFDHRVADGSEASRFLMRVKEILENPYVI